MKPLGRGEEGAHRGERPPRGQGREPREAREAREREPFQPVVEVDFYPEEEPFRVLSQALRTSFRTFELFEIARLILEKPDRFVCVVKDPAQKEGEEPRLYASVPDGLPFRTDEEALAHVFRHYLGEFFETEVTEVDPPSGSFQMVHKCGVTGELLGPPNYHRYQALCREHHAAKLPNMAYARFEQRIESSREEADIQAWLDKMKVQTRYILKENRETVFNNPEDARLHLVAHSKDKLIRPAYSARFSGKVLSLLNPGDPIRRSVESLLEHQRKFPLETANHLRGRLRRMHFAVYKRGSKGISFVCAVKRRFRKPDEVLADNLQELLDFIEAHPNFPARELPKAFLGINLEKRSAPAQPAEESTEAAGASPSASVPSGSPVLTDAEKTTLQQLKVDLRYLVSEGYVTEYSDGRLFVPPIREEEIKHARKQHDAPPPGGKEAESPGEAESEPQAEAQTAPESAAETPEPEPQAESPAGLEQEPQAEAQSEPAPGPEAEPAPGQAPEPEPEAAADSLPAPESPEAETDPFSREPEKPSRQNHF